MKQKILLGEGSFSLSALLRVHIHLEKIVHFWKFKEDSNLRISLWEVSGTLLSCGVHTEELKPPKLFL